MCLIQGRFPSICLWYIVVCCAIQYSRSAFSYKFVSAGRCFPKGEIIECPIKTSRMLLYVLTLYPPSYISHSTLLKRDYSTLICSISMPPKKGTTASRSSKSSTATPCVSWVCFNIIPLTTHVIPDVPEVALDLQELSNHPSSLMTKRKKSKSSLFQVSFRYILVYYLILSSSGNSGSEYDDMKGDKGNSTCVPISTAIIIF